jgi:hypothetical protein
MVVRSRRNSVQTAQDQRYDVLQSSSSELGWSNLFAEVRSLEVRAEAEVAASPRLADYVIIVPWPNQLMIT